VAEEVGIEGRWGYFDQAGQMRDMIQNHLLQILCMIAMSPPSDLTPTASVMKSEGAEIAAPH
jgi:glucose-6-phosphate 1-dehydrogenase